MKIQKIAFLSSFLLLVTSFSIPTFAQSVTPTKTIKELRDDFNNQRREELKDLRNETKTGREDTRTTIAQQRKTLWTSMKIKQVQLVADRILKELDTRYNIILKLKTKIAGRITAKSATFDTSAASAKLALWSDTQYQTDLTDLKTKMAAITSSSTPKDLLPGIRQSADVVRKDLRDLQKFLVDVMKLVATSPKK